MNIGKKDEAVKKIETVFLRVIILDPVTAMVEAMPGVEVDSNKARQALDLIENAVSGSYGLIVNRKSDYSIVPIDVFNVLNRRDRLIAITIVLHRRKHLLPVSTEKIIPGAVTGFSFNKHGRGLAALAGTCLVAGDKRRQVMDLPQTA